jgi:hypothetical protein
MTIPEHLKGIQFDISFFYTSPFKDKKTKQKKLTIDLTGDGAIAIANKMGLKELRMVKTTMITGEKLGLVVESIYHARFDDKDADGVGSACEREFADFLLPDGTAIPDRRKYYIPTIAGTRAKKDAICTALNISKKDIEDIYMDQFPDMVKNLKETGKAEPEAEEPAAAVIDEVPVDLNLGL